MGPWWREDYERKKYDIAMTKLVDEIERKKKERDMETYVVEYTSYGCTGFQKIQAPDAECALVEFLKQNSNCKVVAIWVAVANAKPSTTYTLTYR